jgi:asparagine synthase (glutamine-hydrolysing)
MCGIAGVWVRPGGQVEPAELRRMAGVLRHRGPDGFGIYLDDSVGLAHTRLSIIDRAGGAQPLSNENGTIWVAFNGEIFNYVELREELVRLGHVFRTRSDTEVIVHAYEQWQERAWRRLNGQFAIALWDAHARRLTLVRDRVGIVPLFYARSDDALVFASEAKALFAGGRLRCEPNACGLAATFTMWATPCPQTVFKNIQAVRPGETITFDSVDRERHQVFSELRFEPDRGAIRNAREAAEELELRLARAVALRLRADVPVGAYLSGGLDSAVIAALVREADSSALETFSLRFADPRFDEGPAQQRMASFLGTRHHEVIVGPKDIQQVLERVVWHSETPLLRAGPAPMFLLSALVRDHGMRVVLTGEGADEFLGGYDIFKEAKIRRFWSRDPESDARAALLGRIHPYVVNATPGAMWQQFFRQGLDNVEDPFYAHRLRWGNTAWTLRFLAPDIRSAMADGALDALVENAAGERQLGVTPLSRAQQVEIATFMTPYLLTSQGDRAAMSNGVEGRYPFLDPDVIDLCLRLPDGLKIRGLRDKVVLRELARRRLPEETWRRRKWPYRAPIGSALFGPTAPEYARALLAPEQLSQCPLIDARPAAALAARAFAGDGELREREEMALMGLLTLQIWWRQFISGAGAAPATDIRATLIGRPDVLVDARVVQTH